jgi:SAM-dependent methyltransferase
MFDDSHLEPEMALEAKERDKNAEDYDRHFSERHEREVVPTTRFVGSLQGKRVIEYGAGTGRLTEILSQESVAYLATDMSFRSLQTLARKQLPPTLGLVWTEAAGLRTGPQFFDTALTFQMIEHMPKAVREKFYSSVSQTLKRDGYFVASVYHQDLRRKLKGLPQEGKHPNGIFFHCFKRKEFAEELSEKFSVKAIRPTDVVVPLQGRLKLPIAIDGVLSRFFARVPLLRDYGHIIMAKATPLS